jgi:hypothetical protein
VTSQPSDLQKCVDRSYHATIRDERWEAGPTMLLPGALPEAAETRHIEKFFSRARARPVISRPSLFDLSHHGPRPARQGTTITEPKGRGGGKSGGGGST